MEFSFSDEFFDVDQEEKDKDERERKKRFAYVPKQCSTKWFKDYVITGPATLDDCGVLKNQADLLFYQRNYAAALEKYKERLKYLVNKNNNAVLRELHMCIIHCCLKLNLNELAYNHLMELLKTTGNPADSSVPILAYHVFKRNQKFQEAAVYLYKSIEMNPWYTAYWLEMFDLLQHLHSNTIPYLFDGSDLPLNEEFFHLLLLHIIFIDAENQRSRDNESNVKAKETLVKIEECKKKINLPCHKMEILKKLHLQMRDPKSNGCIVLSVETVLTQSVLTIYSRLLFQPLSDEKRQK